MPAAWGGGCVRNVAVQCISRSSLPALAIIGLRGAEWCNFSARAIATDIRSCRNMERSRRSLRRWAALLEGCPLGSIIQVTQTKERARLRQTALLLLCFPSDNRYASHEQPKHRLCTSLQTAGNHGNTARCVNTSTTSMEHATAVVDDVPAT